MPPRFPLLQKVQGTSVCSSRRTRRRRRSSRLPASRIRPKAWHCKRNTHILSSTARLILWPPRIEGSQRRERRQVRTWRRRTRTRSNSPDSRGAERRSGPRVVYMHWQRGSAKSSSSTPTFTIRRAMKTSGYVNSASTKAFLAARQRLLSGSMRERIGRSGNGWRRRGGSLRRPR